MAKRTPRQQAGDTSTAVLTAPKRRTRVTPRATSSRWTPTDEDIRARAYLLFLARGGADGRDFDDWLEAERQLKAD